MGKWFDQSVRLIVCDPPYEDDPSVSPSADQTAYWYKPHATTEEARRKLLRKQIFASLVTVLQAVARYRPVALVGAGQGGLIALVCSRPLVLEAACRARIVTSRELIEIRKAWVGVVAVFGVGENSD